MVRSGLLSWGSTSKKHHSIGHLRQLTTKVAHVLPVSDDGGSTAEIVRVLGGPAVGDIRSRCLRLADDSNEEVCPSLAYRFPDKQCQVLASTRQRMQSIKPTRAECDVTGMQYLFGSPQKEVTIFPAAMWAVLQCRSSNICSDVLKNTADAWILFIPDATTQSVAFFCRQSPCSSTPYAEMLNAGCCSQGPAGS